MTDLSSLITALEKAEGPSRELDARIHHFLNPEQRILLDPGSVRPRRDAVYGPLSAMPMDNWTDWEGVCRHIAAPPVTASLDAATALVERLLPGCAITTSTIDKPAAGIWRKSADGPWHMLNVETTQHAATLPIAICLAALKAREAGDA